MVMLMGLFHYLVLNKILPKGVYLFKLESRLLEAKAASVAEVCNNGDGYRKFRYGLGKASDG